MRIINFFVLVMRKSEESILNDNIGAKITMARNLKNITKTELCKIINVSIQQLDKYEKGINRVSAAKLEVIAKYLDIDITYFYYDVEFDILNIKRKKEKEIINSLLENFKAINKKEDQELAISVVSSLAEKKSE